MKPYWTNSSAKISSQLSWLMETDHNNWTDLTTKDSWFSSNLFQSQNQNLFKKFYQSYTAAHPTEQENTITASKKIRILPNKKQKLLLKQWLGAYRYVYNTTLDAIQKLDKTPSWIKTKTDIIKNLPDWAKIIPYQIKSLAIKEAIDNLKQQKYQAYLKHTKFRMRFKSKKATQQSCYIPKSAIKDNGVYPRLLGKLKYTEPLPDLPLDSRLVMAYNKFYVLIPYKKQRTLTENQGNVVAIDPGIRKFITFVSHNKAGFLGKNDVGRIYRLCHYLDDILSRMSKAKSKKHKLKKASYRIHEKIKNLIDELHHKVALFLVKNFDLIFLPTFETQQMVSRAKRKIRSKTARAMMTFSHYKFKQFLKHKAFEYGKIVVDCSEAYTSKTNNFTGELNHKLGGIEYVVVNGRRIDRDINGALGILLKALGDSPMSNKRQCTC